MRHAGSIKTVRLDIAHHANDRRPLNTRSKSKFNLLSDWIFVRPITPRQGFVDHSNCLRLIRIRGGEISPGNQRNFHSPKIFGIDHGNVCNRCARGIFRAPLIEKGE